MRRNVIYAWVISAFIQIGIVLALYLNYSVIHLRGSSLHLFSVYYPIIAGITGIAIPILLYFFTRIWHFGIKSSLITGFFALLISAMITYYLITQPEARGAIFLPAIIGIIEVIYIAGNLIGTLLAYILSRMKAAY